MDYLEADSIDFTIPAIYFRMKAELEKNLRTKAEEEKQKEAKQKEAKQKEAIAARRARTRKRARELPPRQLISDFGMEAEDQQDR